MEYKKASRLNRDAFYYGVVKVYFIIELSQLVSL